MRPVMTCIKYTDPAMKKRGFSNWIKWAFQTQRVGDAAVPLRLPLIGVLG